MAATKKYAFEPDYIVPPGETLKESLESIGMSQADLAVRLGMAEKTVSQIINGVAPISVDTAYKLERVLRIPASFWNRRELAYREALTKKNEEERLQDDITWLDEVPVRELIKRKHVEPTKDKAVLVGRVLGFFGVSSVEAWRSILKGSVIQFRGGEAHERYPGYVAAWRRIGVLAAQDIETQPFSEPRFIKALKQVRQLTTVSARDWNMPLRDVCAAAGVAVVLTPEIPKASISGAARWLTKDKALIQLSLKYKTDDQFWFSFFHEAGHILKHGKRQVFVDYGYNSDDEAEREANEFARDFLIPPQYAHRLPLIARERSLVKDFARSIGIAPGIVVGRLQHDGLLYRSAFYDLKRPYDWNTL